MSISVAVVGASGRVGGLLLDVLREFPQMRLGAAIVSDQSTRLGERVPGHDEETFRCDSEEAIRACDAVVDFSAPQSSLSIAELCAKLKKPLLIGTTGLDEKARNRIASFGNSSPIALVPNTSIGVFALKEVSTLAQSILGARFDIEIVETHHRMKKDAPSGTALFLAETLSRISSSPLVTDRSSKSKIRETAEIGVSSVRGGDVVGEHTVSFHGDGESLEITHRVRDRRVFARGALMLLSRLISSPSGFYEISDLYKKA